MAFKGLRQLLTDQGSEYRLLRFGKDRPEGGDSGQPFIQQKLPPAEKPLESSWPDFLIRDPKNAINNRVDDLERIGKFLITPAGLQFIAKQELLSLQNPIVPGRPNRTNPVAGLYYPYMTLGQIGLSGTGVHIEKQGASPIFDNTEKYATQYPLRFSEENANRLVLLYESTISGNGLSAAQQLNAAKVGVSTNSNFLLSYLGGPNVGINGKTTIGFASDRRSPEEMREIISDSLDNSSNKTKLPLNSKDLFRIINKGVSQKSTDLKYITIDTGTTGDGYEFNNISSLAQNSVYTLGNTFPDMNPANTTGKGAFTLTQRQLIARTPLGRTGETSLSNIGDFRADILKNFATPNDKILQKQQGLYSFDYQAATINREQRIGLGNPGKRTRDRTKLSSYDNATVDRINILPLYKDRIVLDPIVATRDLIKFRFEVIDNNDPGASTFIHFRAFLGAITDNFKADWNPTKYIGRAESFYNYSGFSRDISFSFKVAAQSRAEMKSIYQKLNYLASSLAPDYGQQDKGYMKGNLIRLTIGDLYYSLPGFIPSLTYNIPEEASWEIAFSSPEGGEDTGLMETPKYFEVNVSYTPIHDFVPRIGQTSATAFITPVGLKRTQGNSYLDNAKIYETKNASLKDSVNIYGLKKANELVKTATEINPNNLELFATDQPKPPKLISVPTAPGGQTNFAGDSPVSRNAQPFSP
jgi:hypothetical protein